jgi:hypothetical protein
MLKPSSPEAQQESHMSKPQSVTVEALQDRLNAVVTVLKKLAAAVEHGRDPTALEDTRALYPKGRG